MMNRNHDCNHDEYDVFLAFSLALEKGGVGVWK